MFKKDSQGYYYESEKTNRRYELFEMKSIGSERNCTSDIMVIVDFHNSSNIMHQINFLGYLWGATNFNPNDKKTIDFVSELVSKYEFNMEIYIKKAVEKKRAISFASAEDMLSYLNNNLNKGYANVEEMEEKLYEHWYKWCNTYYYLPDDLCEYLFHIKSNF